MSDTDRHQTELPDRHNSDVLVQRWRRKAAENKEQWGDQSVETLLLATQEELGELSQALLEYRDEDGVYSPLFDELDDLGPLLIQLYWAINAHRIEGGEQA